MDGVLGRQSDRGTTVEEARCDLDSQPTLPLMQEVPFQYPPVLVDSLRKRFHQEDIRVSLDQLPGVTTSLRMYSLSQADLNHARRIIERKPFKNYIHISQITDLTKLEHNSKSAILEKGYNVTLQMPSEERGTGKKLLVHGFEKREVKLAHQLLKKLVDNFTVKTAPLQCSPQEMAYFKLLIVENTTQEVKSLLEAIGPHVQVSSQDDTILLSGTSEAIQRANTQILQSHILQGVLCTTFTFNCHSDFLAQIEQYIVEPMRKEGHLDVLFTYNKFPHAISAGNDSATFSILVFSKEAEDLTKASSFLQVLDPQTKSFKIHPEALPQVKKIASQLENKFRVRISHHSEPTPTVVVHGLCTSDTEGCWRAILNPTLSSLSESKWTNSRSSTSKLNTAVISRQNCEIHFPHTSVPQLDVSREQNYAINIKGKVRHVELATERIKNLCSGCQVEMCQLECPTRHLRVWRKRWDYLKRKYEEKHDLVFDFKYSGPTNGSRRDESTTLVTFSFYGSDQPGIIAVKEKILTQENGQSVEEKQIQLSDQEVAVLSGLQRSHLNPEMRYCVILDTNSESNLITLTARSRHDLLHSERNIFQFIALQLNITHDKLVFSSSFLPVFYKPDFAQFDSKLQEELCVACIYPKPRKVLREVLLQRSSHAHTITFQICSGCLVAAEVDAIVNTANGCLSHHSGLAKAIADAGGPSIQSESDKYIQRHGRLNPGDSVCLGSGDLPCSHIIHTVEPVLKEAKEELLHTTYSAVLNSLECANRSAISSIALPAFAADIFGVPTFECAKTSVKAVCDFCQMYPKTKLETVQFLLFNTPTVNTFVKAFDTVGFSGQSVPAQTDNSATPHTAYKWSWQDQQSFSRYSQDIEEALTVEYRKSPAGRYHCWIGDQHYEINFQTMTQKNVRTNYIRKIRKESLSPVSASSELPNLKQIVITIRGPMENLPEAKLRIEAKLESSNIVSCN